MKNLVIKRRALLLSLLWFSLLSGISFDSMAQKAKRETLVDPLTVSGTVGTQLTSSWNNVDLHFNAPFSALAYANMTFNIYGVCIPVTVNYITVSATPFDFSNPKYTISVRPMWRKFYFYFGTNSMNFSNYTYNGISFTGVGMEYKGEKLRFGGFYGTFNRSTTFSAELDNKDAIQYLSDSLMGVNNVAYTTFPQFKRKAYAAHIAVGSLRNYVDFSLLHAADDRNSLPEQWYMINMLTTTIIDTILVNRDQAIKAKENLAMGLRGHFSFGKHVMFETNLGASLFTPDLSQDEITIDGGDKANMANDIIHGVGKTGLFTVRYGSEIHFAGDALLNLNFKPVTTTITYRFVQPNYTSLGANRFNQNSQAIGGNLATTLFRNRARLNLNGNLQQDNLDGKQKYTNRVGTYTVNWSNFFGERMALAVIYNGVTQQQLKGLLEVPEETRVDKITHSIDLTPTYTIMRHNDHTFGLHFNYLQNMNRNKKMVNRLNVNTTSFGVGYDVRFKRKGVSLDFDYDYSISRSPGNDYNSHGFSGGITFNFVKKKNYTLSGNARVVLAFNMQKTEEELSEKDRMLLDYLAGGVGAETMDVVTNDVSVATRLGASFNYKDHHKATLSFSISNYSDNIVIGQHVAVNTDVRLMFEYSYNFASRWIKSKKHKQ